MGLHAAARNARLQERLDVAAVAPLFSGSRTFPVKPSAPASEGLTNAASVNT